MQREQRSKQALIAWANNKNVQDVMQWHKQYTPWFTNEQIIILAESYYTDEERRQKEAGEQYEQESNKIKKQKQKKKEKDQQQDKKQLGDIPVQAKDKFTQFEKLYMKTL